MSCNLTPKFGLPLIDPTDNADPATDINALANKTDSALELVQRTGQSKQYVLPPASRTGLGGVIVGEGLEVDAKGKISAHASQYHLPPASTTTLGGVMVGAGINITPDGVISTEGATIEIPDDSITTEKIVDLAVTEIKIADGAVTSEKLATPVKSLFDRAMAFLEGVPKNIISEYKMSGATVNTCAVYEWGRMIFIYLNNLPVTITAWADVCTIIPTSAKFQDVLYTNAMGTMVVNNGGVVTTGAIKISPLTTSSATVSIITNMTDPTAVTCNGTMTFLENGVPLNPS